MKKFISFIMATAMVAALIPATAFAVEDNEVKATARVIGSKTLNDTKTQKGYVGVGFTEDNKYKASGDAPELQLTIENAQYTSSDVATMDITVSLDDATFIKNSAAKDVEAKYENFETAELNELISVERYGKPVVEADKVTIKEIDVKDISKKQDEFTMTIEGKFQQDDLIRIDLSTVLDSVSSGKTATVSVDSDMLKKDDITFAKVKNAGFEAGIKKVDIVAQEERVKLTNPIKIKETVAESFKVGTSEKPNYVTLKLSKGFEFYGKPTEIYSVAATGGTKTKVDSADITVVKDDEIKVKITGDTFSGYEIADLLIEATSAKKGAVATVKISVDGMDTVSVEIAKVVDYVVNLSVDDDKDIPVMYNGVDAKSTGLTVGDDHNESLEITIEESFPGAWSMRDGFKFTLPDGVYVTDMEIKKIDNFYQTLGGSTTPVEMKEADFKAIAATAYGNGDFTSFDFKRRVFDDVNHGLTEKAATITFELTVVADPDFIGDVVFGFEGGLVEKQKVTIAKFVAPFQVKAEQNDLIIDYRNTKVDTKIVVTEAEAGLWADGNDITLSIDRGDYIQFEKGADFAVNKESDLEISDTTTTGSNKNGGQLSFKVKDESDDKAAVVTISDMELFMQRSIPAGAYDLTAGSNTMLGMKDNNGDYVGSAKGYNNQTLLGHDVVTGSFGNDTNVNKENKKAVVGNEADYSTLVHKAFVNVITAGSDKDKTFTTEVIVPVGEKYLMAGGKQITLDVPAYISASGYTMLPVRAVAKAIGVDTNNVIWNAEARTVTIMYAQRIITMVVGETYITVNGSTIPASSAPEITEGRTFLPLRDLAVALGVSDIDWDTATKTATLNGGKEKVVLPQTK